MVVTEEIGIAAFVRELTDLSKKHGVAISDVIGDGFVLRPLNDQDLESGRYCPAVQSPFIVAWVRNEH